MDHAHVYLEKKHPQTVTKVRKLGAATSEVEISPDLYRRETSGRALF
jgi:hypothetical protein